MVMNSYNKPRTDIARGIPIPVLILIAVVVGMTLLARMTKFGRYVFAMGGNPEAANLSGINVRRITLWIFILMGMLCAVAAIITTARLNAGTNSMGTLAELSVIAAAVIGGTALAGGRGTIPGAILGAVIIQSLDNGMVLLNERVQCDPANRDRDRIDPCGLVRCFVQQSAAVTAWPNRLSSK